MIGANLPDVDALAYVFGDDVDALAFRRGWTHGILAMAALPVLLAGALLAFDRFVRVRRRPEAEPARARALLGLSALGILSHPLLDFLNTYGVRFLAPFSGRWFYGDALFIVDPWVWLALAAGIVLSRRRERRGARNPERPARVALGLTAAYVAAMLVSGIAGRVAVAGTGAAYRRAMVGPVPADPFRRQVILDLGDGYRRGVLAFRPGARVALSGQTEPSDADAAIARAAAATERGRKFLSWSRFPIFRVDRGEDGRRRVVILDARYPVEPGGWASAVIPAPGP